jgi:CDP-diglyceride synthetase
MAWNETQKRTLSGAAYALVVLVVVTRGAQPFMVFSAVASFYTAREIGRMKALSWVSRLVLMAYAVGGFYLGLYWAIGGQPNISDGSEGYLWERIGVPFFLIWASDSFAYVGGRWLGKTPLAPQISPKKTWEGAAFGAAGTALTALVFGHYWPQWSGAWHSWVLGLLVAVAAPVGDLLESYAKRKAGIKDSGVFLPGHGGWFDRLDSYLLVGWVLGCLGWFQQ